MSSRPVRMTRSSAANQAAAANQPPSQPSSATRTRKLSTVDAGQTSTATSATRSTRLATGSAAARPSTSTAPAAKSTRRAGSSVASASANTATTARPLWNSAKLNAKGSDGEPGTPGALKRPTSGLARPLGTPKPTSRQGSLLAPGSATARKKSSVGSASGAGAQSGIRESYMPEREPIKAYLRIRPRPAGAEETERSYIQLVNDNEVLMVPPADHRLHASNSSFFSGTLIRSSELPGALNLNPLSHPSHPDSTTTTPAATPPSTGTTYKFTEVFGLPPAPSSLSDSSSAPIADPSANSQSAFFTRTTLPLVHDFLSKGENCLLFAFGTTGSGKTWTVQGGQGGEEEVGILPRVLDVVWRSLEGKGGAEPSKSRQGFNRPMTSTPTAPSRFGGSNKVPAGKGLGVQGPALDDLLKKSFERGESVPAVIPVDEGYEYSIRVSYAEVYNEKIYDLLESPLPNASNVSVSSSSLASASTSVFGLFSAGGAKAKAAFKGLSTVKRSALSLKQDKASGNKYVAGMKEIKVGSAEEARGVLDRGQVNRRVYGTLANRASSRSHSIFTIKIVKTRKGAPASDEGTTSKFSIVDLAGSERQTNTGTTGDRLKEAANINRSLMVLNQCMETLRKNQEREKGRKALIVPFRHSKLTELFQSFFVGDGRVAMIVNVNPYTTTFDENSHVMKFSAVATGVMTIKNNVPTPIIEPAAPAPDEEEEEPETPIRRKESRIVRLSMVDGGDEEDVIYEEEDPEDDEEEEDEFVNALIDELGVLRAALFESQMNTVMAESQARSRVVDEYEKKLQEMEKHYQERLREEALESEIKYNAKLDILTRLQADDRANGTPGTNSTYDDSDEEEESFASEENSRHVEEEEGEEEVEVEKMLLDGDGDLSVTAESVDSPSPLASKTSSLAQTVASPTPASSTARRLSKLSLSSTPGPTAEDDVEDENDGHDEEENAVDELVSSDVETETELHGDVSHESIEVPLQGEDDGGEVEEDASFDESFDAGEELDASDEEYEPEAPVKVVGKKSVGGADKKTLTPLRDENVEYQVPLKGGDSDEEVEDGIDEFGALDRSMVIRPGSTKSKKPKRKLGGTKVKDADHIEAIADELSPMASRTVGSMGSARSFRR